MAILGLDLGSKNIGVAVSDDSEKLAVPLATLQFDNNGLFIDKIRNIVADYKITAIVAGAPYSLNVDKIVETGESNFALKKTIDKIDKLKNEIKLPVYLQDERFSSAAAYKALTFENSKPSVKRGDKVRKAKKLTNIDALAATYILQTYLDSKTVK